MPRKMPEFACPACGAKFPTQEALMEHGKMHAASAPAQQFKCQACGATFATQAELQAHGKTAHPM